MTRYRVLQTMVAFLVALGSVALVGTWAWAQEVSNPAAQQGGQCQGAEELGTFGPDDRDVNLEFRTEGDKFRLTYKTTNLDDNGVPFLDVTILDADNDEVGGQVIREQGTETEIVTEAPGTFILVIEAEDLTYEITVDDCTGRDRSSGNGGSNNDNNRSNNDNNRSNNDNNRSNNDNNRSNNDNNRSSGIDRSAANGQYGRGLGDDLGFGDDLGLGDNPGLGIGQDTGIPDDVITDTIPNRPLPDTGGPPLAGPAVLGLACMVLGVTVLRSVVRSVIRRS